MNDFCNGLNDELVEEKEPRNVYWRFVGGLSDSYRLSKFKCRINGMSSLVSQEYFKACLNQPKDHVRNFVHIQNSV